MTHEFKDGDLVRVKPEWANSEEEKHILFVITKDSIRPDGKCKIKPVNGDSSKMAIVPSELVSLEMLAPTGFNITDYIKADKRIYK